MLLPLDPIDPSEPSPSTIPTAKVISPDTYFTPAVTTSALSTSSEVPDLAAIYDPLAKPTPTVKLPVVAVPEIAVASALSFEVVVLESSALINPPPTVTDVSPAVVV